MSQMIKTSKHTPVWATDNGIVSGCGRSVCGNTEISEFNTTVLVCQNIRALDISMYYTLVVQIYQSFEDLAYIHGY